MKKRKSEAGFTMVEVLVALVLTGIAMSGLLAMFGKASASSRYSRRATEATVLAQDQIERLRASGASGTGTQQHIDVTGTTSGLFTRTWTVTENAAYADLVVRVTWDDDDGDRTVTVRSRRNR